MFRKLALKANYTSESDDLYADFFLPVLTEATTYKRAVGFFSLGVLLNAPAAMSRIVEGDGQIQLIFGKLVSTEDFEAMRAGIADPWSGEVFPSFKSLIEEHPASLLEYRIRLLAWLFASGKLEIKVAIRPQGMFHQKIGILEDRYGDFLSFSGSMNETVSALDPQFNSEEISVFRSWNEGQLEYLNAHREKFDRLWSEDTGSRTIVAPLPEAIEHGLKFVAERFPDKPTAKEEDDRSRAFIARKVEATQSRPTVPDSVNGNAFAIRRHQVAALKAWSENGYNGILELATGAGKTITAIYAAVRTIERNDGIVLIAAVPYVDLADQWCEELAIFNIRAVRCYGSRADWEPVLQNYLSRNGEQQRELLAIVVVNKTLKTDLFQSYMLQFDPSRIFFIGDECHHHSSEGFVGKLLPGARFRIGLSATPFHYLDEERNLRLRDVYDRSVYEYSLADAVAEKVLTPYEYHPIPVELTGEETVDYVDLSDQIARAYASSRGESGEASKHRLNALLMKRARLVGAAANKLVVLEELLERQGQVAPYSLFYCSDGRTLIDPAEPVDVRDAVEEVTRKQRHAVARLLQKRGARVSPFTSDENPWQRREILSRFKSGETQALVAIRCLDEGIDVPACRAAYLIASSRNPRQFVQRRGRILRRSEGKDFATIYDFVVVLPEHAVSTGQTASDFLRNELGRVADFARNSLYPASSIEPLMPWLQRYGLEHMAA